MGDPCCKAILHLTHLIVRRIATNTLMRIGSQSITPPFRLVHGMQMGSIPNISVLRNRLPKDELNKEVQRIFKREESAHDINDPDDPKFRESAMAKILGSIGKLGKLS